jgi:hypothetical protein
VTNIRKSEENNFRSQENNLSENYKLEYKRKMRAPHSTLLSFYTLNLELFNLDILRVLGEQTLETRKEVK